MKPAEWQRPGGDSPTANRDGRLASCDRRRRRGNPAVCMQLEAAAMARNDCVGGPAAVESVLLDICVSVLEPHTFLHMLRYP